MRRWLGLLLVPAVAAAGTATVTWEPVTTDVEGGDISDVPIEYELQVYSRGHWTTYKSGLRGDRSVAYNVPVGCYTIRMFAIRTDYNVRSDPSEELYTCIQEVYYANPQAPEDVEVEQYDPEILDTRPGHWKAGAERALRQWRNE